MKEATAAPITFGLVRQPLWLFSSFTDQPSLSRQISNDQPVTDPALPRTGPPELNLLPCPLLFKIEILKRLFKKRFTELENYFFWLD